MGERHAGAAPGVAAAVHVLVTRLAGGLRGHHDRLALRGHANATRSGFEDETSGGESMAGVHVSTPLTQANLKR